MERPSSPPDLDGVAAIGRLETGTLDSQVSALLAQATRAAEAGHLTQARTALERSLKLATPERLRRPFFEASPLVRDRLLGGTELGSRYPWLEPGSRVTNLTGIQPLTNKEHEVLGHLAHLLTTEEIAGTMFVTVNTVRTHVRSILRKLGVSRRNEAVRRAWELGLIPAGADDDNDNNVIDLRDGWAAEI
jgi:LuxR family maltose regulon positive regulatory protein